MFGGTVRNSAVLVYSVENAMTSAKEKTMKKVLFLIHDMGHGGAEKVLVNLANNLDPEKFEVTVVALFGGGVNEQFLKEHIQYRAVFARNIPGNSKWMKLMSPGQLHRLFIRETYDIEISYLEGPSARIISGCPNPQSKLVSWIHGEQHTKAAAAKAFRSYQESAECYSRFDRIICVSESVKADFRKLYPMLREPSVLYNTNETDEILIRKDEPTEEVFQTDDAFRICGVGKIIPNKGFDKLARIHKRLIEDGWKVHTYILGTGSEQEKIERYLKENQIESTFTFLGYQTNPYKYVARCDLFVCCSETEGFSTAATEALIVGTPVVTTPVAGMEEMLGKNREYGVIAEMSEDSLYEAVKEFIKDRQKLEYYQKQAKIRGAFFSKEHTVKAAEEMLLRLDFRRADKTGVQMNGRT